MTELSITLIQDNAALAEWAKRWEQESVLAVDTEFMRTQTYYPKAGLIQVAGQSGEVLIDPLAIQDFEPLKRVLANPAIVKVLHACSEDLELFQCLLGEVPKPLFDTQIACAFLGMGLSIGYQRLVETELQVSLPESATRSDWLQRPLSQTQLAYAAADVHHLLALYAPLRQQLQEKGFLHAVEEECATLVAEQQAGKDPELLFLKLRGAWRLNRSKQKILQQLCMWRESEARQRDLPRSQIAADPVLIEIAACVPKNMQELSRVEGVNHRLLKQYGDRLTQLVREFGGLGDQALPATIPRPLPKERKNLFARLRGCIEQISQHTGIPEPMLCRKATLEQLTSRIDLSRPMTELPIDLSGWRVDVTRASLIREINAYIAEQDVESPGVHL